MLCGLFKNMTQIYLSKIDIFKTPSQRTRIINNLSIINKEKQNKFSYFSFSRSKVPVKEPKDGWPFSRVDLVKNGVMFLVILLHLHATPDMHAEKCHDRGERNNRNPARSLHSVLDVPDSADSTVTKEGHVRVDCTEVLVMLRVISSHPHLSSQTTVD